MGQIISLSIDDGLDAELGDVSRATGVAKAVLIERALEAWLAHRQWFEAEVRKGIADADSGNFASDEDVAATFARWQA